MLKDNSTQNRKRFGIWYFCANCLGIALYFLFMLLGLNIVSGVIGLIVEFIIIYYFTLCLLSYAKLGDSGSALAAKLNG